MVLDLQPLKSLERHPFLNKVNSLYFYNYLNQYVSNEGWRQGARKEIHVAAFPYLFLIIYLFILRIDSVKILKTVMQLM